MNAGLPRRLQLDRPLDFARAITRIRRRLGVRAAELVPLLKVSRARLLAIEGGRRAYHDEGEAILKLLKAVGCDAEGLTR